MVRIDPYFVKARGGIGVQGTIFPAMRAARAGLMAVVQSETTIFFRSARI